MKTILAMALSGVAFSQKETHLGELKGQQAAIDPRNPSEQLEMACVGLWVGEQNKKYWKSQQGL